MDDHDYENAQQMEERRRQEEDACGCTITTSLFDLCPACADKAWHYGHIMRKRDQAGVQVGQTFEEHGPLLSRKDGTFYYEQRLK